VSFVISCSEISSKGNHLTATFVLAIKQIRVGGKWKRNFQSDIGFNSTKHFRPL